MQSNRIIFILLFKSNFLKKISAQNTFRMSRNKANEETDKQTRIAIVSEDKCKPKRCRQECKKSCPVVRMGKLCIEVSVNSKIASLSEELCIGCGICVKVILLFFWHLKCAMIVAEVRLLSLQKCPFDAIMIINVPSNLEKQTTHRYSKNSFKLHRLPIPRPGTTEIVELKFAVIIEFLFVVACR